MSSLDNAINDSILLFNYCTRYCGYNAFIIDDIDSSKLTRLREYIDTNNRVMCAKLYKELSKDIDILRDKHCYNSLPYKSSFRQLAKELYLYMKESWLLYNDEYKYLGYMLKKIKNASHEEIKQFLSKRSYSLYYMDRIPVDPDTFYCHYLPIEFVLYYIMQIILAKE